MSSAPRCSYYCNRKGTGACTLLINSRHRDDKRIPAQRMKNSHIDASGAHAWAFDTPTQPKTLELHPTTVATQKGSRFHHRAPSGKIQFTEEHNNAIPGRVELFQVSPCSFIIEVHYKAVKLAQRAEPSTTGGATQ